MSKLYVSEWLKIGASDSPHDRMVKQASALHTLAKPELNLLLQMVERKDPLVPYAGTAFLSVLVMGLGLDGVVSVIKRRKLHDWLLPLVRLYDTPAFLMSTLSYLVAERDYDNLLMLGRHIQGRAPYALAVYVDKILRLLKEYRYGKGGPANPVSCLIAMGPEVTMQVERYLKTHRVPSAAKRWREFRTQGR